MSKWQVIDYNELLIGTLRISPYDYISETYGVYRSREARNKLACFTTEDDGRDLASDELSCLVGAINITPSARLFVTSKVRTARDLFRNSNYQIVRDPERADYVVIPELPTCCLELMYDVAVLDNRSNALCLYSVERPSRMRTSQTNEFNDKDFELIKEHFKERDVTIFGDGIKDGARVQFLPKIEEYKDMLLDVYPNRKYIFENDVTLTCPITISPEILELWSHYTEADLLAKAICNSDWKKYPFTLLYFLLKEKDEYAMQYCGGTNFKLVLDTIGYDRYTSFNTVVSGRSVEPDDWNMLQDYLMHKLHLPEMGGYITPQQYKDLEDYRKLLPFRVAVKPMKISSPIQYENLLTMVGNS